MISVADAVTKVLSAFRTLPAEQVSLERALGRVLAEDIAARITQPPLDVSAMDGYAVRVSDATTAPAVLRIVGESAAGSAFTGRVGAGETVRISTGAPVPEGADAIIIQEVTKRQGDTLTIHEPATPGRWIRTAGMDFQTGEVLLHAGRPLTARDLGLAAAMNVPWLMVRRKPRIAFIATGDEVVMPGDPLGPSQIISSNSITLNAGITALGAEPLNLGIARDDEAQLRAVIEASRGADLLVTTGGVSVGDHDLVGRVLGDQDLDVGFYKVAMRPGKPLLFGRLGQVPFLGMPGNPVSVGVSSIVFLKPAIETMLGLSVPASAPTAILGRDLKPNDERQDYLRAGLTRGAMGQLTATPFERQDSAMLALFTNADCLVIRPPYAPRATRGEPVDIIPLRQGLL
ncbi:MAG: molybdopterin molybdotransferase MoeA [Rhodospirillales bacterium]|nr:molybdopterin molybdotransferase MoeA [Rhodospirillales bacterium]